MPNSSTLGNSSEPVLILIHGATLNGHMWDPVGHHLNPRYRRLAPDLPGHGSRRDERYTLEGAVATIVAAARSVGAAPVILVGDSLGAYTAMASAGALAPDQLKGLVLGGATFNFFGSAVFPYVVKGAIFRGLARVFGEQRLIDKLMPKTLGPAKLDLDPVDAKALMDAGLSVTVFSQAVQALRRIDFRAMLAEIRQPVLIVNGDRDKVNIRQEQSFLAVARNASSHRFKDCEHGVSLWRHAEFAGLVNAFADRVFAGDVATSATRGAAST
ncbi:MAG: alpha/beta hydrolase [Gammaproteobacteria bacterium]|nr:alpha/beta hydrolase [Gammaproteobacteria bacterium]